MSSYHEPVMPVEVLEGLRISPGGIYVDATFGGGGHARLILEQLGPAGRLIAFDQDADARQNAIADKRFELVTQNFRHLKRFLRWHRALPADGILADLGISSYQIDTPERGFSIRYDAPLDMRMNEKGTLTAADIVNTRSAEDLQLIFQEFGEVSNARTLARAIVTARQVDPILSTARLLEVVAPFIKGREKKYLAQVFQALRIAVNDEIQALKEFLEQTAGVLKPGGRLVVISYHSLEDRLVKNFIRRGGFGRETVKDFYGHPIRPLRELNKKPLLPGADEIERNPRSRSAKLRIAEKIENDA